MRPSLHFARGLACAAALIIASPLASAAPAKRHKPKRAPPAASTAASDSAPAVGDGATNAEGEAAAKPKPEGPAPGKRVEGALTATEETPSAAGGVSTVAGDGSTEARVALSADAAPQAAPNASDEATLGRREAMRIAAGRTEVGVSASVDLGNRRFRYNDEVGSRLRPYQLPLAPMLSFGLEAYPLATSDLPVLRDLGFRGRLSRAFAVDSSTPDDGAKIETNWTRFGGDIRERLLIPGRHSLEFGAFVGMDANYFMMSSKSSVSALLPSARTLAVRFGLDARALLVGRFSVLVDVAYLAVTTPGAIFERFRDPSMAGVDGDLGCSFSLIPGLEARLNGRYTRYFASFKPIVGDAIVAGGALDEQLQVGMGVRYAH